MGSSRKFPELARPPKRINAFGLEKEIKSQKASPKIYPVKLKISIANLSPFLAAS